MIPQLRHASLYLICEEIRNPNSPIIYCNPLAIVAANEGAAISLYYQITNKDDGIMLCELENRCDEMKVEPID